ncbi:hypothetical protein SAMN06265365_11013 [Tistlia consotensis]|uniref:Uncharacterized protein n=1 Tax=Tistlia consotensis USBA 355 TaxID=560819 RepID=A0A1Y6BZ40_9PROT|nr:hypothetical protein [Tistlia consotensis]SMF28031.1 hypothetical protein SAMN05428998_109143 [Tistlia consotensis USBA 355]SNR65246.1 hypothetical protein SAMN06265365_11013 [Tistlia consotensis]
MDQPTTDQPQPRSPAAGDDTALPDGLYRQVLAGACPGAAVLPCRAGAVVGRPGLPLLVVEPFDRDDPRSSWRQAIDEAWGRLAASYRQIEGDLAGLGRTELSLVPLLVSITARRSDELELAPPFDTCVLPNPEIFSLDLVWQDLADRAGDQLRPCDRATLGRLAELLQERNGAVERGEPAGVGIEAGITSVPRPEVAEAAGDAAQPERPAGAARGPIEAYAAQRRAATAERQRAAAAGAERPDGELLDLAYPLRQRAPLRLPLHDDEEVERLLARHRDVLLTWEPRIVEDTLRATAEAEQAARGVTRLIRAEHGRAKRWLDGIASEAFPAEVRRPPGRRPTPESELLGRAEALLSCYYRDFRLALGRLRACLDAEGEETALRRFARAPGSFGELRRNLEGQERLQVVRAIRLLAG